MGGRVRVPAESLYCSVVFLTKHTERGVGNVQLYYRHQMICYVEVFIDSLPCPYNVNRQLVIAAMHLLCVTGTICIYDFLMFS